MNFILNRISRAIHLHITAILRILMTLFCNSDDTCDIFAYSVHNGGAFNTRTCIDRSERCLWWFCESFLLQFGSDMFSFLVWLKCVERMHMACLYNNQFVCCSTFIYLWQQRHRSDSHVNNRKSLVLRNGLLKEERWHKVRFFYTLIF